MKRIGQAKAKQSIGIDKRKNLYGIYDTGFIIYEGYEFTDKKGNIWVEGLPYPRATHLQPHLSLKEYQDRLDVHYF